jgi:predicted PurR-regulated permease PerM
LSLDVNRPSHSAIAEIVHDSAKVLGLYAKGQAQIFAWTIVLYGIGFAFSHVPLWFAAALVAACLGLMPRVGSVLALGMVLFMSWVSGRTFIEICEVFGVWLIVQSIEGFYLTPKLLGKPLGLTPFAVLLVLTLGSLTFGPIGLLLAVPTLAVGLVWFRRLHPAR